MHRLRKACLLILMLLSIGVTPAVWATAEGCEHSVADASSQTGTDAQGAHLGHSDMAETESGIENPGCGCACICVAASCVGTSSGMAVAFHVASAFRGSSYVATAVALAGTQASHDFELIRPPSSS